MRTLWGSDGPGAIARPSYFWHGPYLVLPTHGARSTGRYHGRPGGRNGPRSASEVPLSTFSVDATAGLPGSPALAGRRRAAAARFAETPLPTAEEEVWRYSRIDALDLDRFEPAAVTSVVEPGDLGRAILVHGDDAAGRLAELPASADALTWLHHALAVDPIVIEVPAGASVPEPIVVRHRGPSAGSAAAPHLLVRAGADSEVRVVEVFEGGDAGLLLPTTQIEAAGAARLGYLAVQQLERTAWSIGTLDIVAEAQATVTAGLAGFGGDYARVRTDCRLVGRGATGALLAAYFGDGDQTLDYRTFQDHVAPDTTSNLLFKGAVSDRSRSVYTGLIRVAKEAHGTNAFQTNRNIKLSEDAWAESVPNLQIENNDVHCSHASAVGPIDEEQRFYLESRGVPPRVAERLIVAGFFADVFDAFPATDLRATLDAAVAAKLTTVLA